MLDVAQRSFVIKQIAAISPALLYVWRKVAQKLHDLCQVVIVFGEDLALRLWLEEILRSQQLKHQTCDAPYIDSVIPVTPPDDSFRRAILPCLNILGIVSLRGRRIPKVGYLYKDGVERGE